MLPSALSWTIADDNAHAHKHKETSVKPRPFLVVIDGSGELSTDFSVVVYVAGSPQEALDRALADGYGKEVAYVAALEHVVSYTLGERRVAVAEVTPWSDIVASTPEGLRQYMDPDKLAHQ